MKGYIPDYLKVVLLALFTISASFAYAELKLITEDGPLNETSDSSLSSEAAQQIDQLAEEWGAESNSDIEPIPLTGDHEVTLLGGSLEYFINEDKKLSAKEVVSGNADIEWQLLEEDSPNFSYDRREYWFHFRVFDDSDFGTSSILQITYPLLDHVDVYLMRAAMVNEKFITGDALPFNSRPINHQSFLFPLQFDHDQVVDVYVRVETTSSVQVPVRIWTEQHFWLEDRSDSYMDGIFFGAIFVMLLYNLFICISARDKSYLYYVLYMASIMAVQIAIRGAGFQYFWPNSPGIQDNAIIPSLSFTVIFASMFFVSLLNLKERYPGRYLFFKAGIIVAFGCFVASFFLPYATVIKMAVLSSLVITVGGSVISIGMWMQGDRLAGYYSLGWGAVILSFMFYAASLFGLIERSFWIEYAIMIGAIAEVVIFSFALADAMNMDRKARLKAQYELIETQREANKKLDQRVKERTLELEEANKKLHNMSLTDGLTGVKNRRYFDEHVEVEYNRAYRENTNVSLLLVDIDFFKKLNDSYGHQFGDDCLVEVAKTLRYTVKRPADAVSRYGGEEFAILLPDTSLNGASHVGEKVREAISELSMSAPSGDKVQLNISVGVASYIPQKQGGVAELIKLADDNLYIAKESGRNCVIASDDKGSSQPSKET